jgi:GMP synthase (glutamine-hydrolysing)
MNVLALIHGVKARSGVFGELVRERGHQLDEWSLAWDTPAPRPVDDYGAVMVFGGAMHADQDDRHPWLREENLFLQRLLDVGTPLLGVCLGAQLIAKAAHAPVFRAEREEIGWHEVELSPAAREDPLFAGLPWRFAAFQWHYYTYGVPAGAVELARSPVCTQAYRLGPVTWGIQFHAEVTREVVSAWLEEKEEREVYDEATIARETEERIDGWNELGRRLCAGFVDLAERTAGDGARTARAVG